MMVRGYVTSRSGLCNGTMTEADLRESLNLPEREAAADGRAPVVKTEAASTQSRGTSLESSYGFRLPLTNNTKRLDLLKEEFAVAFKNSKKDFAWCRKDISGHSALVDLETFLSEAEEKTAGRDIPDLAEFALGEIQRRRVERYLSDFRTAQKSNTRPPLLIVSGMEGMGKRSLILSIAKELGLAVRDNDQPKEEGFTPGANGELVIFDTAPHQLRTSGGLHLVSEAAVSHSRSAGAGVFTVLCSAPYRLPMVPGFLSEQYSGIRSSYLEIMLGSDNYKKVMPLLTAYIGKLYGYRGEGYNVVAHICRSSLKLSPETVANVYQRAAGLAKMRGLPFTSALLEETVGNVIEDNPPNAKGARVSMPTLKLETVTVPKAAKAGVVRLIKKARRLETPAAGGNPLLDKSRLAALLYGPPGTGKTMTVKAVAGSLGRALFSCDFGSLVEPQPGQTEANLSELFARASMAGGVLFIDEADTLLSSRDGASAFMRGVINHLLVLLEEHEGMIFLSTNTADHLDEAVARRVTKIKFPLPNEEDAAVILTEHLTGIRLAPGFDAAAAVKGLKLSGGLIKNAASTAFDDILNGDLEEVSTEAMRDYLKEAAIDPVTRSKPLGFSGN